MENERSLDSDNNNMNTTTGIAEGNNISLTSKYLRWRSLPKDTHPISGNPDERDLALIRAVHDTYPRPWNAPHGQMSKVWDNIRTELIFIRNEMGDAIFPSNLTIRQLKKRLEVLLVAAKKWHSESSLRVGQEEDDLHPGQVALDNLLESINLQESRDGKKMSETNQTKGNEDEDSNAFHGVELAGSKLLPRHVGNDSDEDNSSDESEDPPPKRKRKRRQENVALKLDYLSMKKVRLEDSRREMDRKHEARILSLQLEKRRLDLEEKRHQDQVLQNSRQFEILKELMQMQMKKDEQLMAFLSNWTHARNGR